MSRLPWDSYAYRGHGGDEGGMEHLETDVMRFMAILAFCLVAIFALVQSMPLDPPAQAGVVAKPAPAAPPAAAQREPVAPSTATTAVPSISPPPESDAPRTPLPAPVPGRQSVTRTVLVLPASRLHTPPAVPKPLNVTVPAPAATLTGESRASAQIPPPPTPPPDTATPAPNAKPSQRGFSLRFDSDHALRELVSRDAVALYAMDRGKAWRVMLVGHRLSFRPAQVPATFHEMAADTVPGDVVSALRRRVTVTPASLRWGVTLPAVTTQQLGKFIAAHEAGSLVIDGNGSLRLEAG